MSSRSKDLISATLVSAGVIAAGEIRIAYATTGSAAFRNYWTDWFDNELETDSVSSGEAAMTAGRNDVLLVGPGSHDITSALSWNIADSHIVGCGGINTNRPRARLQLAGTGALNPMFSIDANGVNVANLTFRHGRDSGANSTCFTALRVNTGTSGASIRNCFIWGPEDDTLNDSTGYKLIFIGGKADFYDCLIGYGYPIAGTCSSDSACLVWFKKSIFNNTEWHRCTFHVETAKTDTQFLTLENSPAGGMFHTFRDCLFMNVSTTSMTAGLGGNYGAGGALWTNGQAGKVLFCGDTYFAGCTDVCHADGEGRLLFPPSHAPSTATAGKAYIGLAMAHDHTA